MTARRKDLRPDLWMTQERLEGILRNTEVSPTGCWLWNGYLNVSGYAIVAVPPRGATAVGHRLIYAALVGPVPVDRDLDHLCHTNADGCVGKCDHRRCINPDHLEITTHVENCERGRIGDAHRARAQLRTSCKNGHEYTKDTVRITPQGWRDCRPCNTDRARRCRRNRQAVAA